MTPDTNPTCPTCKGSGGYEATFDGENWEYVDCPDCHGTGKALRDNTEQHQSPDTTEVAVNNPTPATDIDELDQKITNITQGDWIRYGDIVSGRMAGSEDALTEIHAIKALIAKEVDKARIDELNFWRGYVGGTTGSLAQYADGEDILNFMDERLAAYKAKEGDE